MKIVSLVYILALYELITPVLGLQRGPRGVRKTSDDEIALGFHRALKMGGSSTSKNKFCASSCNGNNACGGVGDLDDLACRGVCNGGNACLFKDSSGEISDLIGDFSCVGTTACFDVANSFNNGEASCIGESSCQEANAEIGDNSCLGESACFRIDVDSVGRNACIGEKACCGIRNVASVGDNECIGDFKCCNSGFCTCS